MHKYITNWTLKQLIEINQITKCRMKNDKRKNPTKRRELGNVSKP